MAASGRRSTSAPLRRSQPQQRQLHLRKQGSTTKLEALAAAERGDINALRLYLRCDDGHESCGCGFDGKPTMLQVAALRGDLEMAELLVDHNCRINAQLPDTGDTALMMALDGGHAAVAALLIRHEKCDYNAQNNAGYTALMRAAVAGLTGALELLLMCGPDLECATQGEGHTALSLAVSAIQPEAVRLLMEFGANPLHVVASGKTVEKLAWSLPESGSGRASKRQICEALMQRSRGNRSRSDARGRQPPDASSQQLIGGRYKKLGLLGDGAHGLALLVRDMRSSCGGATGRVKVLKRISGRGGGGGGDAGTSSGDAAAKEISVLKQIHHSCVLAILDYFTENDTVCIVTEYCGLRDLQLWTHWSDANDIALPARLVTHWLLQMLLGLHYLHSRRIIHRDLKPSNVFVKADASVRIGDFGCSRQLTGKHDCAKTISGTWLYMSPEVLQNEHYGTECDMWSLGCTLYELCTGRSLFGAGAAAAAADAHADDLASSPSLSKAQLRQQICGGAQLPTLPTARGPEEEADAALPPAWLGEAFVQMMVRAPAGSRASAAGLLSRRPVRLALAAMDAEALAADRAFLGDNRAAVIDASSQEAGSSWEDSQFTNAYDQLLADAQRALETLDTEEAAAAEADRGADGAGAMSELERLRSQLAEMQRGGFPLDRVHQLLAANAHKPQKERRRLLARVTRDAAACEMVERAMMLELQCLEEGGPA